MNLLDKLSSAFQYYTDYTLFVQNDHIFIDSIELYLQFDEICNNINKLYNRSDISNFHIIIKEDMNIKVFVLSYCVIRICSINIYNERYIHVFDYIQNKNHSNLEQIYNIYLTDKYIIIVSKCIIPLITNNIINPLHTPDYTMIYYQMYQLIDQLIIDGYSHNDVRIDNIGYDPNIDKYVLFDFDKFNISNINNDLYTLNKSIQFYILK